MVKAGRPPECMVLTQELCLKKPPCETCVAREFFSFWRSGQPKGCWVAHTALTALESLRMKPRLARALLRLGVSWTDVEKLTVLHDTGKLTKYYGRGWAGHNVFSMVIAAITCGRRSPVAQAVFLHHEAMHWGEIYRMRYPTVSLADTIRRWQREAAVKGFRLREGHEKAVEQLRIFLDIMGINSVTDLLEVVKNTLFFKLGRMPDDIVSRLDTRATALYWVLYLADNRAASARDGPESYWLYKAREMVSEHRDPSKLAEGLLKNHPRSDIALTALPDLRGGEGRPCPSPRSG